MSTVLRATGYEFDVDSFVKGCTLTVCAVWRRGEAKRPKSNPSGPRCTKSGLSISASDADFHEFPRQVSECIAFLHQETEQLRRLTEWPGVEEAALDFGILRRDVFVQCDYFPSELVRLAGELGLGIELTQYPISAPDESQDGGHEAN
jgi:hypothetical protein